MEQYKVTSEEEITSDLVLALMKRYKQKEVPRIKRLNNYYLGKSDIIKRKMADSEKPNNKITNPFPSLISDTIQGYFLGIPVSYACEDKDLIAKLQLVFDTNHEQSHNSKVGKQASIAGVSYELLYLDEKKIIRISKLDATEVFMIYSNEIDSKPLAAVRFYDVESYLNKQAITFIEVYKSNVIEHYKVSAGKLTTLEPEQHYFGDVPIIKFQNNDELQGDFEKVISLIDSYDKAVSDTANDIQYFSDSYMVLSGMEGTESEDIKDMKKNRVMVLAENGTAQWLTKSSSNMEVEEFKTRLKEDIHTLSSVPNLSDESFGTSSGVALRYKLLGLENLVSIKERNMEEALEKRIKLLTNIFNKKSGSHSATDVTMQFSRNLPENTQEQVDTVTKLSGILSKDTLLGLLPFISDPEFEAEKLANETDPDSMYSKVFEEDSAPDELVNEV